MASVALAGIVLFCLLGSAFIGMILRSHLPAAHLSADSIDAIKLATAIVGTLAGIALGFLTASAKTAFDSAEADLRTSVAEIILLDRIMAHYGPETQDARSSLAKFVTLKLDRQASLGFADDSALEAVQAKLRALVPATAAQRSLQARAIEVSGQIAETHWHLDETGSEVLPPPFVVVLVLWLSLLFGTFGLLAPRNMTVTITVTICAVSVAGAVFLIVDMSHPHLGLIQISDAPLRIALGELGRS